MRRFSKIAAHVKTSGDTLNFRSEPNGSILSTLDNGSVIKILISPVNAGGRDWISVSSNSVEGWVAAEFIAEATVLYQIERILDPSVRGSESVGATAFKVVLADKTLKFIELGGPPGVKLEEFSSLSDTELVQRAIDLYNAYWERFKNNPTP
jgi:Bacterial SH3 domain